MALTSPEMTIITDDMAGPSNAALATAIANVDPQTVIDYYAGLSATKVWDNAAPVDAVRGALLWDRFTPKDAPDGTQLWENRSHVCALKIRLLMAMLQTTTGAVPGHLQGFRDGLKDACAAIPSNTNGTTQNGGWTTAGTPVQEALKRLGTRLEVLLSNAVDGAFVSSRYNYTLSRDEAIATIRVLNPA